MSIPFQQSNSSTALIPRLEEPGAWYYKVGRRTEGPHNFAEMRELARRKLILKETEVWQGGDDTRRLAPSVMGLMSTRKSSKPREFRATGKISLRQDNNPYAAPKVATIQEGPPGGLYLPYLRHSSFWPLPALIIISAVLGYFGLKLATTNEAGSTLLVLGVMTALAAIGLSLIYLHRAWEMMRVVGASLAGHKAVTLMAIPLFNAVWSFFALFGWSRAWNYQVKRHPGLSDASVSWPPVFFLFCIAFLASQSLLISYLIAGDWPTSLNHFKAQISLTTFALTLILGLAVWAQLCQAINFLARKKS